ncbi:uncharacterized protein LOC114928856 [Nylanderia fulva]|uniref:uncharacterized protein LOC114928856 n=1 Tax=Nylanderia fulva TaxID=613905 RepID=UPI0010FB80D2|nr:uncharacterized protein LOC114928856 [Nylanderia fulva]
MMLHAFTEEIFWKTVRTHYVFSKRSMGHFLEEIITAVKEHSAMDIINKWYMEKHCPIIKIIRDRKVNNTDIVTEVNVSIQYTDTLSVYCVFVTFTTQTFSDFNNFTHHKVCTEKDLKLSLRFEETGWIIFNLQQIGKSMMHFI